MSGRTLITRSEDDECSIDPVTYVDTALVNLTHVYEKSAVNSSSCIPGNPKQKLVLGRPQHGPYYRIPSKARMQ